MNTSGQNYLKSISLLGEQIKQSYAETGRLKLPSNYGQVGKIAVFGMGGSQLGVDLINNLFSRELKVPIIQIRDYSVPKFVDEKTLVLLVSYSGTTEEVLAVSQKLALNRAEGLSGKSKVVAITVGGKLSEVARKNDWPIYQFDPINNPSGQPRMGAGYMIGSVMAVLKKLNLLGINDSIASQMIIGAKLTAGLKLQAKNLAKSLKGKTPIIVGAEHLFGNAHIIANQINESAKQRCCYFALPELNHHLLEGLSFPAASKQGLVFVFLDSQNYFARNRKRFVLTEQVVNKQGIASLKIDLGGNKVQEAMKLLSLGGLLSYELAKINKVEPDKIPWVNYFKKELGK